MPYLVKKNIENDLAIFCFATYTLDSYSDRCFSRIIKLCIRVEKKHGTSKLLLSVTPF